MRSRPTSWILLTLLLAAGGWLFWQSGDRVTAGKNSALKQKIAAHKKITPNSVTVKSASTAPKLFAAAKPSTNTVAKASPFAHRLSNTTKTIGELEDDPHAILLANAFIDTRAKLNLPIPKNLQSQGDPGAYIVQADGPIDNAFRALLAAAGAQIVSYIPNNAYLVRAPAGVANGLAGQPDVQAVYPYEPYYKLSPQLLDAAVNPATSLPTNSVLTLGLFADKAQQTVGQITNLAGAILAKDSSPFGPVVRVRAPADWTALAVLPGVQIVEMSHTRAVANDLARVTLGISTDTVTTTNNYLGLSGSNVLVEVNDTGIDATHPDFSIGNNAETPNPAPISPGSGRVIGDSALSLVDTNGHGTHVAGIIAGNGWASYTVTNTPQGSVTNADFRGKAPGARLYSVGFLDANGNSLDVPDSYLQETPALTNALISNNSWDYTDDSEYDLAAASYDAAVRDALPGTTGSQPVLFVFAAGNNGGGDNDGGTGTPDSILSPATAKNVITVGALEQLRQITNIVADANNNSNAVWQPQTDSGVQVASYSSRGNVGIGTEGTFGRFKPDVVAPGSFVVSTRSGQWDQAAYYNPTNYYFDEFSDVVTSNSFNNYLLSLSFFPPSTTFNSNVVGVDIEIVSNVLSPDPFPDLQIYASQTQPPDPADNTTYDLGPINNQVSIPPDGGPGYLTGLQDGNLFYAIVNTNNETVNYDVVVEIVATNENGDYFTVLSNLNNTIEPYYRYESGTSMATPAISGVLALMQDYFTNQLAMTPSPALLKAMLINGSRSQGSYDLAVADSINFQGWGLANLTNSLPLGVTNKISAGCSSFFLDQSPTNALATGDSQTFNVMATANAQSLPLRVTLAWTDPPGNPAAAIKLVNNLDLVVSNEDTHAVYFGNDIGVGARFNSAWNTNNPPNLDSINNVENVFLPSTAGTNFSITVIGRSVNVNAVTAQTNDAAGAYAPNIVQDFALVISCGEGEVTNAIMVTPAPFGVVANPTGDQDITFIGTTNTPLFNQSVGASSPLLGTNTVGFTTNSAYATNALLTIGQTNQWHFYVVTNTGASNEVKNAAFVTFLPDTLSIPREGVFADSDANSTRPEADIDLYVSTDPSLTNLNPVVISNCVNGVQQVGESSPPGVLGVFNGVSLGRGGTEFVADTNSTHGQVYYVAVQSEDQQASEYGFLSVFTATPFSTLNNGNQIVNGVPLPVNIPGGSPAHPGIGYVFALALYPMVVNDVTVTNQIVHQNFGDIIGTLKHNDINDVLNNHDSLGSPPGPYNFVYDDSGSGQYPGSQPSDGPGSLQNFTGKQAIGPWILTEVNDTLLQTGAVTGLTLLITPHKDLLNGISNSIASKSWFYGYIDVPVGYTNLTVSATNLTASPDLSNPLELFVEQGVLPTLADTNGVFLTNGTPPGNSISVGPPLTPGRYFVGIYNPSLLSADFYVTATLSFSASAIETVDFASSGAVPILDDAVTTSSITVTNTDTIQDFNVGLRVDHPRISDLVFHLISPDGTRYLLMENRGGTSTNGCGITIYTTNDIANYTAGGNGNTSTNIVLVSQSSGTLPISWNFYTIPDEMTVYDNTNGNFDPTTNLLFDTGLVSGPGQVNLPFTTTDGGLTIIMNQFGTPANGDAWTYTAGGVSTNYYYLAFTEDTNLTTTPIKFAPTPFVPTNSANLYYLPEQDMSALNGQSAAGTWTLEIQDDRAGAGLTNTLDSWQLEFEFANTNLSSLPALPNINTNNVIVITSAPYDAVGDGVTDNTLAIQEAIDAVSAEGGGTVEVPCGIYLSGPIALTNYVNLQIDGCAILRMLPFGTYPGTTGGAPFTAPNFITGTNLHDIEISGSGAIDGQGAPWWPYAGIGADTRPIMIRLDSCDRELIQDVTLSNSPMFHISIIGNAGNTTVQGVTERAPDSLTGSPPSHNTDACDVSGTNILVQNCNVSVGDDDFTCGGGTSDVLITNNAYGNGHGVSIGSYTDGGVSNITVINCTFNGTQNGIRIKSDNDRGGLVQNISYLNLGMTNVNIPIQIYSYYEEVGTPAGITPQMADSEPVAAVTGLTPIYRDITFSNITATSASGFPVGIIWARTEMPATNIVFDKINLTGDQTFCLYNVSGAQFIDSTINVSPGSSMFTLFNAQAVVTNSTPTNTLFTFDGLTADGYGNGFTFYNALASIENTNALALDSFVTLGAATFTVSNDFALSPLNTLNFVLGTNSATIAVVGDLVLGGTYNIIAGGGFASGTYTLMTYTGSLGGNLPALGATPAGYTFTIDTNTAGQVNLVVAPPALTNGVPQTNIVASNSINWYQVNVPANADFATNLLLFASLPVNVLFSSPSPPITDFELLANSTGGTNVLSAYGGSPLLLPGTTYYLGVQNTNSVAVTNAIEVDFHLVSASPGLSISSIVYTNISGTNGFLLTWFAPSNDLFQVQWTDSLTPAAWDTFTNPPYVSYNTNFPASPAIAQFNFFDDGSQSGGFGPMRFYRLILLQATNTLTLPPQADYVATVSVPFAVTNTATDSDTNLILNYVLTSSPFTSAMIDTNGIITWTPDPTNADSEFKLTTVVTDNGVPPVSTNNSFTVFVVQPLSSFPSITNVIVTSTSTTLEWWAPTNDLFQVEWTTNLMPVVVWTPFPDILTSTSGLFTFTDTNAPMVMKFYRLEWLPLP